MIVKGIIIDSNDSLLNAISIVNELNIGRLLVMKKGKLVGIVSDRDLRRAAPSNATALEKHEIMYLIDKVEIKDIMTPNPVTVRQNDTVANVAKIMYENKISGVPVVDQGQDV